MFSLFAVTVSRKGGEGSVTLRKHGSTDYYTGGEFHMEKEKRG